MYTVSTGPVQSLQGWPTLHVTWTLTRFPLDHPALTMPALGCPLMLSCLDTSPPEIYTPLR